METIAALNTLIDAVWHLFGRKEKQRGKIKAKERK